MTDGGIRVHLDAYLGQARDRIQIDVGFGDAVTPGPVALTYPTFLPALPAPDLTVYPIETVVAEKWEATISLGDANTRLKDVIDLDELAGSEPFDGTILQQAIRRTFERRKTALDTKATALRMPYRSDTERQTLWAAARKRYERKSAPERFESAMTRVIAFVGPPLSIREALRRALLSRWRRAGAIRDEHNRTLPPVAFDSKFGRDLKKKSLSAPNSRSIRAFKSSRRRRTLWVTLYSRRPTCKRSGARQADPEL